MLYHSSPRPGMRKRPDWQFNVPSYLSLWPNLWTARTQQCQSLLVPHCSTSPESDGLGCLVTAKWRYDLTASQGTSKSTSARGDGPYAKVASTLSPPEGLPGYSNGWKSMWPGRLDAEDWNWLAGLSVVWHAFQQVPSKHWDRRPSNSGGHGTIASP